MGSPLDPGGTSQPTFDARRAGGRTAACLVVAVDGGHPFAPASRHWLIDVDEVLVCRAASDDGRRSDRITARTLTLWLVDPMVSGRHAVVRRVDGRWTLTDKGSRNGTIINGQRVQEHRLDAGDVIVAGAVAVVFREVTLDRLPRRLDETADHLYPRGLPKGLWTMSPVLERTFADLLPIVRSTAAVMILGETGTGKELAARAIHTLSGRSGAFTPVNCGGLPTELVGSEMFGHLKGAFSGAVADKQGLVTASRGGTLFLDEVAELPLPMQAAMLRALQDGEVRAVGATEASSIDLRVVSATHVDLAARVKAGTFREDLWSRLIGSPFRLPALRDRREDLGLLLRDLLARVGAPPAATFSFEAIRALVVCDWPRNIRQLEQAIKVAVSRADGGEIALAHLPEDVQSRPATGREELIDLLRRHHGSTVKAAAEAGVSRQAIEKRCRVLGLDYKAFRAGGEPVPDESG